MAGYLGGGKLFHEVIYPAGAMLAVQGKVGGQQRVVSSGSAAQVRRSRSVSSSTGAEVANAIERGAFSGAFKLLQTQFVPGDKGA